MPWFGLAEIAVIPAVVCSGVPVFVSAGRGAVPAPDLRPRAGGWDWLHPVGPGRVNLLSATQHGPGNQDSTEEAAQC